MMKIKVVFDHQIFCLQAYGGISRYFVELAKELTMRPNTEATVSAPAHVNKYLKQAESDIDIVGFAINKFKGSGIILPPIGSLVNGCLLKFSTSDIVHETYYSYTRRAPQGAKIVLTVFDMIHEIFPEYFSASDPTSKMKATAVARADHIICISHQTQSDLINLLNVDPAKTTVIHLGFKLTTHQIEACHLGDTSPYLLYVGMRTGYKNFERFLRAVALSPDLHKKYRIVCFGGGPFSAKEQELIKELCFEENSVCQLSGSDAMLAGLYKHACLFVYPSLYEGFGIPPLEAMAYDCPVVCSNVSSIPEVVGDAGQYFDPTSTGEIMAAIERTANDPTLRNTLIEAGRKRIQKFSWERCATETLAVYRKLLI
ncbi:Glycosyltransferase involved in cell wall bisynthesis [Trichlorobacter thiogenes]|uniref:Glycosyltransferase involved in cell wall bisynthesis n=2 Tax=Trichlorobacter thiogenes TaxID=115783 RepID=A0A1T4MMX0_9BACT|nr:Glycosyltransferase involved in cell wall bisynthesis [Trichlorobacter thiogenes]